VTLSGATTLSIYPHVAIGVEGLSIANPSDMGSDAVIQAPRLDTRLRLLPLLLGRVEFDEFQLTSPTIHLVVDNEGRRNWTLAGSAVAERAVAKAPDPKDPLAVALDLQVGHLIVTDGTLLYDNLVSDTREQMTELDLDIDWPSLGETASGRGRMMWRGEPVEFTGLIAAPLQLMRGGTSAARFAIARHRYVHPSPVGQRTAAPSGWRAMRRFRRPRCGGRSSGWGRRWAPAPSSGRPRSAGPLP
jgi:AsmA protein